MNWFNPALSWSELERRLSGRPVPPAGGVRGAGGDVPVGDGGDSPAWTRRREPYQPPADLRPDPGVPKVAYAELHCHSAFS
nr:hypothetical protein [Micromonospora sp. DSM 115978]